MQAIQRHYEDTEVMTFLHFVHSAILLLEKKQFEDLSYFSSSFLCMSSSDWLQSLIVIWDKKQPLHCAAPLTRKLSPFGATHRGNDLVSTNCGRKQPSSFCLMNHKETICLFKDHTFRLRRRLKQMRCQWGRFYLLWNSPLPSLLQKMRTRAACRVKF